MAPGKKKQTPSTSKGAKNSKSRQPPHETMAQEDSSVEFQLGQPPADMVAYIQGFWDTLTEQQRQELLTVDIKELQEKALVCDSHSVCSLERATLLSRSTTLFEVLEQGIERLDFTSTAGYGWKLWSWPNEHRTFLRAGAFRDYVEANHIDQDLLKFLPEGNAIKAETDALRKRMLELYGRVQLSACTTPRSGALSEDLPMGPMEVVDHITIILAAFELEHLYLYHFVLFPVINAVCKALPKSKRATTATSLSYCDLEKIPRQVLMNICDWLHLAVNMLSRFKSDAFGKDWLLPEDGKEVTAEGKTWVPVEPWDCDKFCISPYDRTQVELNPCWHEYLQVHAHGDSSKDCDDESMKESPYKPDLDYRLQWVFGVKCDPDSHRSWHQSAIGTWVPTVQFAHKQFLSALLDMKAWQRRAEESQILLQEMLVSRQALAGINIKCDVSPRPDREKNQYPCELPDHIVVALLKREAMLNRVTVHTVKIQQTMDKQRLRHLQTKQCQGEPKFGRWDAALKAEYAALQDPSGKPPPRSRQDVVTDHSGLLEKFEGLGAVLRAYEAEEREVSIKIAYYDEEIQRLAGWAENTMNMATSLEEITQAGARPLAEGLQEGSICPCCNSSTCATLAAGRQAAIQLRKQEAKKLRETTFLLKQTFQTEVRHQLHDDAEDQKLYRVTCTQLKQIEERQLKGQAVLPLLENCMLNLACNDPGTVIGPQLILPTLSKRLLDRAHAFHQKKAAKDELQKATQQEAAAMLASQELLAEEEREQARAAAKKARKDRAKAKKSQEQPSAQPGMLLESSRADALPEAVNKHTELSTSSTSTENVSAVDQPIASANSAKLEVGPSSTHSGTISMDASDQAEWYRKGRKGSVLPAGVPRVPAQLAESMLKSAPGSSSSSAESSVDSCTQEQSVLHLMMLCPITQAVMHDPVIAADGHTYEKDAMQKWLQHHQTSPVTGARLPHVRLVPNIVIRSVIQQQLLYNPAANTSWPL